MEKQQTRMCPPYIVSRQIRSTQIRHQEGRREGGTEGGREGRERGRGVGYHSAMQLSTLQCTLAEPVRGSLIVRLWRDRKHPPEAYETVLFSLADARRRARQVIARLLPGVAFYTLWLRPGHAAPGWPPPREKQRMDTACSSCRLSHR